MHVLIDATCLGRRKTGNETYTRGLLGGLAAVCPSETRITALVTPAQAGARAAELSWEEIPVGNFFSRNFARIPRLLARVKPELYHAMYWVSPSVRVPFVLMIHDVSFVRHPEWFRPGEALVYRTLIGRAARSARRILTVSEFSRREICEVFGVPEEKVAVTYNAPGLALDAEAPAREAVPYFLAVGNLHPRKNLVRLIEAFAQVARDTEVRLVIVGNPAWLYADVFRAVRQPELAGRVELTGYLSEQELAQRYRHALALVYPSLYEGFGLPVVEAMQAGCAVVVSESAVAREVAGDAALFTDPHSTEAWADAMLRIYESPDLRADLIARGRANVQRFTWEQSARETLAAYAAAIA